MTKSHRLLVEIYTAQGEKVRTLMNADFPAGTHTAEWDGKNDSGAEVASDFYVVLIYRDDRLIETKKVVFQK